MKFGARSGAGRKGHFFCAMASRFSILIDGGFFTKKFRGENKRFPSAADVVDAVRGIISVCADVEGKELLRVFYYDARPLLKAVPNPVTRKTEDFAASELAKNATRLHRELAVAPNFAMRFGELKLFKWTATFDEKKHSPDDSAQKVETDFGDWKPHFTQKGVDLRIGLDVAEMAFKKRVDTIILFSGDTDLVPAMKLARREGLRVLTVVPKIGSLSSSLLEHSDGTVEIFLKK